MSSALQNLGGIAMNHRSLAAKATQGGILSGVGYLEDPFSLFMVQVVIILSMCRVLSLLGLYMKQPRVIFEVIGGILLGPSAIGRNTDYLNEIFPKSSLTILSVVANLGLVLYLFVVGMELDPVLLTSHARKASGIAFIGMAVPFCLGIAISKTMFQNLQADDPKYKDVSFTSFFVFIGTALSITAFPVLARILKESGLIYTRPGAMTMGAAALNDAAAWCLLILAISIANAGNMTIAGYVFLCIIAIGLGLFILVRPILERFVVYVESFNSKAMNNNLFALTIVLCFLCAWTTALLGVDAIFGAFMFGLIIPRKSHLFKECNERIEEFVVTICLPIYFALSGLKTDVTTISSSTEGAMVILVCVVATAGKYIGAGGAALAAGSTLREAAVIGALMNTRGLIELIVLNLGMSSGILSVRTFSVMVIMCLFTTFITCPTVDFIYPPHIRVLIEEENKLKEEAEQSLLEDNKAAAKPPADEEQGGGGSSSSSFGFDVVKLDRIAKSARLGVLVDRTEHFQGLMDLLACFSPVNQGSTLSVTAIKVHEPSLTERDIFIGLNEHGKLVKVDKESTQMLPEAKPSAIPQPKQELLPMSMFLQAVGASVRAYRIRGDPVEFPSTIRTIADSGPWELTVIPWRASQFVERLFWGSCRSFTNPIALFVQVDAVVYPTVADQAMAAGGRNRVGSIFNNSDGSSSRARASTIQQQHGRTRTLSTGSNPFAEGSPLAAFKKSFHIIDQGQSGGIGSGNGSGNGSHDVGDDETTSPNILSTRRVRISLGNDGSSASLGDNDAAAAAGAGAAPSSKVINSVLAIITGSSMDPVLFPVALRFAERKSVSVTVLVASDSDSFSASVQQSLVTFRRIASSITNIGIIDSSLASTDTRGLSSWISREGFDLIMIGYVPPSISTPPTSSDLGEIRTRTARSSTLSAQLVHTFVPAEPDDIEWRRSIGVPDAIASSHLAHPELGELGCAIEGEGSASYLLVIHDPQVMRSGPSRGMGVRKTTLWQFGDDALPPIEEDDDVPPPSPPVEPQNLGL